MSYFSIEYYIIRKEGKEEKGKKGVRKTRRGKRGEKGRKRGKAESDRRRKREREGIPFFPLMYKFPDVCLIRPDITFNNVVY